MGMMTRRNVKGRADKALPIAEKVGKPIVELNLTEKLRNSGLKKTEINRMTTDELRVLADGFGIENAKEMSGNQIKKTLNAAYEE